jgi:hypothetical protein
MKNVFGPPGYATPIVDKLIGTAYPVVRHVAENIEYVKHVSAHLPEVYRVWESVDKLDTLFNSIENLDVVYSNLTEINVLYADRIKYLDIYDNRVALLDLQDNIPELYDARDTIVEFSNTFGSVQAAINATEAIREATNIQGQAKVDAAEAIRVQTAGDRTQTGLDRVQTGVDKFAAAAERLLAQNARDASFALGPKYATEALGRVAVADGSTFLVVGSGDIAAIEYRRISSSSSALIAIYPSVGAINSRAVNMEDGLKTGAYILQGRRTTDGNAALLTDNFGGWASLQAVPANLPIGSRLDRFIIDIGVASNATSVRFRVWRRPSTIDNASRVPDGGFDLLVGSVTKTVAELGITPGATGRISCAFDLPEPLLCYAGDMFVTVVEAFGDGGVHAAIGVSTVIEDVASPASVKGWYKNSSGVWAGMPNDRAITWRWEKKDFSLPVELKAEVAALKNKLTRAFTTIGENILGTGLSTNNWSYTDNFGRYAVGFDAGGAVPVGSDWDAVSLNINTGADATKIAFRLWRRPLTVTNPNAVIGTLPEDDTLVSFNRTLGQLGITAGQSTFTSCNVIFPSTIKIEAGYYYAVEFGAQNASDQRVATGAQSRNNVSPTPEQRFRGYIAASVNGNLSNLSSTTAAFYWRASSVQYGADPMVDARLSTVETKVATIEAQLGITAPPITGLVLPPKLWLTSGRPLPFNWMNALPYFYEGNGVIASISSVKTGQIAFLREGKYSLEIDPDRLGSTVTCTFRRVVDPEERQIQTIPVTVAPATKTGSPKIMTLGDSIMHGGIAASVSHNLTARGMTPEFLGTKISGIWNSLTPPTEAKGGTDFGDWIGKNTDMLQPLAVGQEAAYLEMSNTDKGLYNPFLRSAIGGDPAQRIFGGYIFDLDFYCTRFGIDLPDFFAICLGQNSLYVGTSGMEAEVDLGMETLIGQIRAAAPNCQIGFFTVVQGRSGQDITLHNAMQARVANHIRASSDSKLTLLPAWLHMSEEAGWQWETPSATSPSGLQTVVTNIALAGDIHQHRPNVEITAEIVSSWIAALA